MSKKASSENEKDEIQSRCLFTYPCYFLFGQSTFLVVHWRDGFRLPHDFVKDFLFVQRLSGRRRWSFFEQDQFRMMGREILGARIQIVKLRNAILLPFDVVDRILHRKKLLLVVEKYM